MNQKSLKKFAELYFKQFGVELTEEEVLSNATYLVNLYRAVFGSPYESGKQNEADSAHTLMRT